MGGFRDRRRSGTHDLEEYFLHGRHLLAEGAELDVLAQQGGQLGVAEVGRLADAVGVGPFVRGRLKGLSHAEAVSRLQQWFQKFGIMEWWNRKLEELSKGMQQKVQFIITVLHKPQLLIFDEPFSGFDPVNTEMLKREILALRDEGHTVIFSTHNMSSVEEICDEIALINHSQVVLSGNVNEVRSTFLPSCV